MGQGAVLRRRGIPAPLRRRLSRAAEPVRLRRGTGVVLVLEGEPVAARRSLDSVLAQPADAVQEIRVLVADPALRVVADAAAERDPRVRVEALADPRRAVRSLRGRWALVVPSGTSLRPGAAERLLRGAERDGLPVVGGLDVPVPERSGRGDLDSAPAVALDPSPARVLLPRRALLAAWVDDVDTPAAVLRVLRGGFRVVHEVVAEQPRPGSGRGLHVDRPWDRLHRRVAEDSAALTELREHPAAAAAYARGTLARHADHLAVHVEDATDTTAWPDLVAHVRVLLGQAGDATSLPVLARVRLWLVAQDRRADLERLVVARRFESGLATEVDADGTVRARVEEVPDLPADLLEVGETETPLRVRVARVRRAGDEDEVVLHAAIENVEQSDLGEVAARLVVGAAVRTEVPVTVTADPVVTRWVGDRAHSHDAGVLTARLDPRLHEGVGTAGLEVTLRVGPVTRTGTVQEVDERGSAAARSWGRARPGGVAGVDGAEVDGLDLSLAGVPAGAALVGPSVTLPVGPDGSVRLEADPWGLGARPAATGGYRLEVAGEPVPVADALLDTLPHEVLTEHHRVLLRAGRGGLVVRLDPPLDDAELGPRAQARLQAAYAEVSEPVDPGLVYFQSFTGQSADHPLAIQRELRRRRPDLRVRWLVADASVAVPEGAEPVQLRSREWYDALARAGHVVTNIDLERWFVRRPEQRVLQTYHGYPSKRMGIDQWRARGFPESRIAQDLARSSGTWTALVTPQPDADRWYREQYAYDGPIIAEGYPRNDVLVAPGHEDLRRAARDRLGAGDRKVLLYAPTWRDDLATNFRAARAEHHLDPVRLAADLGPGWLVLLRGHRFHAPGGSAAGVLDVTTYPDVNDLVLAADASVLDYSSLRFDVALTGRPMVFLVPDLDDYTGRVRGFLQDYPATAPGPMVDGLDEVLEHLRDLDALAERCSGPIADLNARFNSRMDGHASERVVEAFFADLLR